MSKNKPTNKKATPKVKKPNGRKTWLKVAGKVHELNKKQNLGWTWTESMRFASKKVYPKFKGKSVSKVSLKDIELDFKNALAEGQPPMPTPIKKGKEICFLATDVPLEDLIEREWFSIADDDLWLNFDDNLPMRFAFDGIVDTGIIKKSQMPNMKDIREEARKLFVDKATNSDDLPIMIFKTLVQPNKKDDGQPCSYYILVTFENSSYDSQTAGQEVTSSKSVKDLSEEEQEKRKKRDEERKKLKKENAKKKKAEQRQKPKEVEPKSITKTKATPKDETSVELQKIKLEKENREVLERVLNGLRQDFKDGVLSKRQYLQRQQQILDKFEKGGQI
jgi:hypothetical protein